MCFQKRYLNVFLVLYLDLGFRHQYLKSCDKYDEITVGEMSVTYDKCIEGIYIS